MNDFGEIYLDAMEQISKGQHYHSCVAICNKYDSDISPERYDARRLYEKTMGFGWLQRTAGLLGDDDNTDFRLLLLAMMAACWQDMID